MNIQPLRNDVSATLQRLGKSKNHAKKLAELPMEQKCNKNGIKLGSCAGMIS